MSSSSRAPPPAPLYIADSNHATIQSPSSSYTPSSAYSPYSSGMPPHHRQGSSSSTATTSSTASHSHKKPRSPTVNVYTTCGRHTDQFLFGGRSFGDMVTSMFKKD